MLGKKILPLAFSLLLGCSVAHGSPFGRWSASGVVVNKTFRPTPLAHSLGVEGIYKLELRDKSNKVRRQMVTRAVFLAYEIGDEFNDLAGPRKTPSATAEQHLAAAEAKKKKNVSGVAGDSPAAPPTEIKNRLASVHFTQDMLPETEGF